MACCLAITSYILESILNISWVRCMATQYGSCRWPGPYLKPDICNHHSVQFQINLIYICVKIHIYAFIYDAAVWKREKQNAIWTIVTPVLVPNVYINLHALILDYRILTLQWRHNGRDGVSNHQGPDCLLNCLFRRRSKKTSKLCVTGLCEGNSPVTSEFPAQMASNAENVSIWWRHHGWWINWPLFPTLRSRQDVIGTNSFKVFVQVTWCKIGQLKCLLLSTCSADVADTNLVLLEKIR